MYPLKIPVAFCFLAIPVIKASPQFGGHKKKASKIDMKIRLCRGTFSRKKVGGRSTKMVQNLIYMLGYKRAFCYGVSFDNAEAYISLLFSTKSVKEENKRYKIYFFPKAHKHLNEKQPKRSLPSFH